MVERLLRQLNERVGSGDSLATLLAGLSNAIEALQAENESLAEECRRLSYDIEVAHIATSEARRRYARLQAIHAALPTLPQLPTILPVFPTAARILAETLVQQSDLIAEILVANGDPSAISNLAVGQVETMAEQTVWDEVDLAERTHQVAADRPAEPVESGDVRQRVDTFDGLTAVSAGETDALASDHPLDADPMPQPQPFYADSAPRADPYLWPVTQPINLDYLVAPEIVDRAALFGHAPSVETVEPDTAPLPAVLTPQPVLTLLQECAMLLVFLPVTALTIYSVQQLIAGSSTGLLIAYLLVGLIGSAILAPILGTSGVRNLHARDGAVAASVLDVVVIVLGVVLAVTRPAWMAPALAISLLGLVALVIRSSGLSVRLLRSPNAS